MIEEAFVIGAPVEFHHKCLIYPPTIKDIVANEDYSRLYQLLTITQEDLEDEFKDKLEEGQHIPTPFEFLLANCYNSIDFKKLAQKAFLLFTKQSIDILYEQKYIILGGLTEKIQTINSLDELTFITEEDYFEFQNLVRMATGAKPVAPPQPEDPNEDPRIRRMKAKARYRDRIKAKKGVQGGINLMTCIASICCMGIGITPLNIGEMSYASINIIMRTYQEKEKYDIDIRSLLAGESSKKINPKYWIRNLND